MDVEVRDDGAGAATRSSAVAAARAQVDPPLPPAKYKRAFIVTYGRSGSTLLQGVLNALPGYLIRGENQDTLSEIRTLYEKLPRYSDIHDDHGDATVTRPEQPFYGLERFRDETLAIACRKLFDFLLCDDQTRSRLRCLGFKEIRYEPETVEANVDFLRMLFPGCAIIFNIRKPEDVAASEFQRNKSVAYFRQFNAILTDLASVYPDTFLVRYEDVVAGSGTLRGLYSFLGEPFDAEVLARVLEKKHSYHSTESGSAYSDIPAAVRSVGKLRSLELFVVRKMVVQDGKTKIEGIMIERPGKRGRQFASLRDELGQEVAFTARYGLPSPQAEKKLKSAASAHARFEVTFTRGSPGEYRLFFADEELALVVQRTD